MPIHAAAQMGANVGEDSNFIFIFSHNI